MDHATLDHATLPDLAETKTIDHKTQEEEEGSRKEARKKGATHVLWTGTPLQKLHSLIRRLGRDFASSLGICEASEQCAP